MNGSVAKKLNKYARTVAATERVGLTQARKKVKAWYNSHPSTERDKAMKEVEWHLSMVKAK